MLNLKIQFLYILSYIIDCKSCNHNSINNYINPFYDEEIFCPECGDKIVIDWYLLKCSDCKTRREGIHVLNNFLPKEQYCIKCGNDDYIIEIKNKLAFFELHQASFKKRETSKYYIKNSNINSSTKVWIEPENYNSENIFLDKLLPVSVPV